MLLLYSFPNMVLGGRENLHVLVTFYLEKETPPVVLCQSFFFFSCLCLMMSFLQQK